MNAALTAAEKSRREDHVGLVTVQSTLAETTGRLVKALPHPSARGWWGELQLRRVVELAGMLEHCDFEEQVTVDGLDGRRLRPDLVVKLVGGRTIVIDAKTPMESFVEAQEADTEEREKELRVRHAKAVKAHMNELGAKTYWSQFDDTPEFVVMFFPNEAVFAEAMRLDPGLLEFGTLNTRSFPPALPPLSRFSRRLPMAGSRNAPPSIPGKSSASAENCMSVSRWNTA